MAKSKKRKSEKMSSFNYKKWDNIELSDDESDLHPNIDKVLQLKLMMNIIHACVLRIHGFE